ncbi:nucleotidyltransferase family protein [Lysobacter terrae]
MEAVVLAGGFGTRLRHLVPDVPKPMAQVAGRPFLEILLSRLAAKRFERVVLSVGYLADRITDHFGSTFAGMALAYEVEAQPLGTGGAIRRALANCREDHVYVFNGDTYLDLEVDEVEKVWERHHQPLIVGRYLDDTSRYGRLDVDNGQIRGFREKGDVGPGLINAGCYVFPPTLLDSYPNGAAFSLELDFLSEDVLLRPYSVFTTRGEFIDIGTPDDFVLAQTRLAGIS